MKLRWLAIALALASLAAAPPGKPRSDDPEGNLVSELVVQARHPGPAWWRVEKGESVVYILGAPDGALPPGVDWDRRVLEQRLGGAKLMIPGASLQAGVLDLVGALQIWPLVRSHDKPLAETLGPDLAARFEADARAQGRDLRRYEAWRPFLAVQLLQHDQRAGGAWDPIDREARRLASAKGVPVRTSAVYPLIPFAKTALHDFTPASEADCVGAALDDVEAGLEPYRRAAEGWARGDVAAALAAPRAFDRCLLLMAGGPDLWRRMISDQTGDIEQALATPGHAVAVIPLRRLLAKGGVIESLQARGLEVDGPL